MLTFIARRALFSIPVLVVASMVIFFGVSAVGDPLGAVRTQPRVSQQTIQNIVERNHLDEPLIVQYGYWVKAAVTDQFGNRLFSQNRIWPELRRAMGHTLQLVIVAEILALTIGITVGVISAKRQYSAFDYATTTVSFLGYSMPIFWFALILQVIVTNLYLATDVRLFYTGGLSSVNPPDGIGFLIDRLQHLALPIIALAYVNLALYSRYMRASMLDVINSDYVRTARAKGLRERIVIRRHALRNALIPIATVAAINLGSLFGGVIVTETVFGLDGMGLLYIKALGQRDAYVVMAYLMVTAVFIILFNLIADLLYSYLDPRIRHE